MIAAIPEVMMKIKNKEKKERENMQIKNLVCIMGVLKARVRTRGMCVSLGWVKST